jgi:hypothetical protein
LATINGNWTQFWFLFHIAMFLSVVRIPRPDLGGQFRPLDQFGRVPVTHFLLCLVPGILEQESQLFRRERVAHPDALDRARVVRNLIIKRLLARVPIQ